MSSSPTHRDGEHRSRVAAGAAAINTSRRPPVDRPAFLFLSEWMVRNAAEKVTAAYVVVLTWASLVSSSTTGPTADEWFVPHSAPMASLAWFRFDVASNVALYVPVGALTAMTLLSRGSGMVVALLRALLAAAALSLCLETLQIYVPNRVSSTVDWAANMVGAGIGAAIGVIFEETIRGLWRSVVRPMLLNPAAFAPAAWLVFVCACAVWPIELPLRAQELAAANPPGSGALFGRWNIHLAELAALEPRSVPYLWELQRTIEYGLSLVTAGVLSCVLGILWVAVLRREYGVGSRSAFGLTVWIGGATSVLLAGVRSVLPSAGFDPTWALFAMAGLALGAGLEAAWRSDVVGGSPAWSPRARARRMVLVAMLLFILACETAPFLIRIQDVSAAGMFERVDWVPFHAYLMQRLPRGVEQIGAQLARWAILGFLIASGWRVADGRETKRQVSRLALRVLLLVCALETIQTLMPTRTPDVTDVMLAVAGAVVGACLRQARPRATTDAAALGSEMPYAPGLYGPS